ncbi:hypothetical protein [Couchioplanes azureus]|uniref:hypothetical protein n=1 Tax=Couchioplanes caeruleus TaxID=56438 RepID=UPI001670F7FA|nr:hypothetical protein [Couchioplanes caeruleus]GGQ73776.1 hypothetical protein GCM10010166_49940 [Couchioplanes caeruleus subsp. azureus]
MTGIRSRSSGPLLLASAMLGAVLAPGAALADGPGYGGTADALTVQWQTPSSATADGLAVYAVGFKGGSPVNLRVGADPERSVIADASGALRVLVLSAAVTPAPASTPDTTVLPASAGTAGRLSPGTSVLAVGETPAGVLRTLVGSVPPPEAGRGMQDLAPWAGAAALAGAAVVWTRRRGAARAGAPHRHRFHPRHRMA